MTQAPPGQVGRRTMARAALLAYLDALGPGGPGSATAYVAPPPSGHAPPPALPPGAPPLEPQVAAAIAASDTGAVLLWDPPGLRAIIPPVPVDAPGYSRGLDTAPLRRLLGGSPLVAAVLVRLGRYAVGVYRGEELIGSRVGRRYVKGRHRAGGSSAARFSRAREKQAEELFKSACQAVRARLEPYEGKLEHLFLGGERTTLLGFRRWCPYLERLKPLVRRRVLDVREPGLRAMEVLGRRLWQSVLYEAPPLAAPEGGPSGGAPPS